MKLTINTVTKGLTIILVNYEFIANKTWRIYIDFVFDQLKDKLTDREFNKACNGIIDNEANLYGKKPTIAMFLQYGGKQELDPEQQAELEAERIIDTASYPTPVLFDNKITNATLHNYGGIGKVYFDVHDSFNRDRKSRHWVKKELSDIWLSCHTNGETSNEASYPAISSRNDHVSFVGDKVKCQELLDNSQKLLEAEK